MKKFIACALSVLVIFGLAACSSNTTDDNADDNTDDTQNIEDTNDSTDDTNDFDTEVQYVDGEYTGEGTGFGGPVSVTITVANNEITSVSITGDDETENVGQAAFEELEANILVAQSLDFDAVSGATYTYDGVYEALLDALSQASAQ